MQQVGRPAAGGAESERGAVPAGGVLGAGRKCPAVNTPLVPPTPIGVMTRRRYHVHAHRNVDAHRRKQRTGTGSVTAERVLRRGWRGLCGVATGGHTGVAVWDVGERDLAGGEGEGRAARVQGLVR